MYVLQFDILTPTDSFLYLQLLQFRTTPPYRRKQMHRTRGLSNAYFLLNEPERVLVFGVLPLP